MEWLWSPWDSFVIFCGVVAKSCSVQIHVLFLLFFFSLQLSKLTVPVLKEFVKQAGIKCGTKKADLVEAIKDHFGVWFFCILKRKNWLYIEKNKEKIYSPSLLLRPESGNDPGPGGGGRLSTCRREIISHRRQCEYRRIVTETKSRWPFANIHVTWGD